MAKRKLNRANPKRRGKKEIVIENLLPMSYNGVVRYEVNGRRVINWDALIGLKKFNSLFSNVADDTKHSILRKAKVSDSLIYELSRLSYGVFLEVLVKDKILSRQKTGNYEISSEGLTTICLNPEDYYFTHLNDAWGYLKALGKVGEGVAIKRL